MLTRAKNNVEIGDRFIKTDEPTTVWIVAGRGSSVAPVPHFQVVKEGVVSRVRTLSQSVLLDKDYYRRLD